MPREIEQTTNYKKNVNKVSFKIVFLNSSVSHIFAYANFVNVDFTFLKKRFIQFFGGMSSLKKNKKNSLFLLKLLHNFATKIRFYANFLPFFPSFFHFSFPLFHFLLLLSLIVCPSPPPSMLKGGTLAPVPPP